MTNQAGERDACEGRGTEELLSIWRSVDHVAADEVTHVRFGQVWAKELAEGHPERRKRVIELQRRVHRACSFGGVRGSRGQPGMTTARPARVPARSRS